MSENSFAGSGYQLREAIRNPDLGRCTDPGVPHLGTGDRRLADMGISSRLLSMGNSRQFPQLPRPDPPANTPA